MGERKTGLRSPKMQCPYLLFHKTIRSMKLLFQTISSIFFISSPICSAVMPST